MRNLVKCFIPFILLFLVAGCDQLLNQNPKDNPPDAPRQLTVQLNQSGAIEFVWVDGSDNESGFRIEYQTQGSIVWNQLVELSRNVTSYAWNGAQENTTYSFRVYAFNDVDNSDFSYSSAIDIPFKAPTNLTATVSGTSIVLNWQDNSHAEESYRVQRRIGTNDFIEIANLGANTINYTDTEFPSGAQLAYRVVAGGGGEFSAASNVATLTAPITIAAATNLTATVNGNVIQLSWTDNSTNETGFRIERKTAGGSYSTLDDVGSNVATYTDEDFPFDTNLVYRVFAVDGEEESSPSNEATVHSPLEMITIYEDDFESYTLNHFIGAPWEYGITTDQVTFGILSVNPSPVGGGQNLIFWDNTIEDWGYADLPFSAFSKGRIEFDINVIYDADNPYLDFGIGLSIDQVWQDFNDFGPYLEFNSDGKLYAADGSDFVSTWQFPTNEWYHMVIEFDVEAGTYRVLANGNVAYDNLDFFNNKSGSNVVGFSLICYSNTMLWAAQIDNLKVISRGQPSTSSIAKSTGSKRGPIVSPLAR
ncbi:MAG: fibronectin type III domain-containing protein [bacterium]